MKPQNNLSYILRVDTTIIITPEVFFQTMIYVIGNQRRFGMSTIDSEQYKKGQRQGWNSVVKVGKSGGR